jgi:inner membrane protein
MTGRTHDLAAVTALGVVVLCLPHPQPAVSLGTAIVAVFANLVGGIAPDIDQPTAPLWRNLPVGGYFGRVFDALIGGHRFLTHSIVGVVAMGYALNVLLMVAHPLAPSIDTSLVWWAFMIGMGSHLVMDTFTKEGVPWLLPLPIKFGLPPIKRLRVTTGKFAEVFVIFPGLLAFNAWLYCTHYRQVLDLLHRHVS